MSRIYRDARRLHGRGPYKDHLWFCIRTGDKDWTGRPAFYFEIAPDYYSYGLGFWAAAPATMERFRRHVAEHPEELGGEIEFHIDGEKHIFTKSTMVFLPAGLPHCPLVINRADRPIFHYSVLMAETYSYLDPETGEPIAKD